MSLLQTIYNNEPDLYKQVKQCIDNGADVNHITEYSESALRVASNNGRFDVVKLLIDSGADKSQLDWSPSFFEVVFGDLASLERSIQQEDDLEHTDFWSRTPWLVSILAGDIEKCQLLLELGAEKQVKGRCGKPPLFYAVERNNVAMLDWLIHHQGLNIETTDDYLETPLIMAAELGQSSAVRYLIDAGADIFKSNHIPHRAIQVAHNLEIVQMLVTAGDDINDINEEMHALLIGTSVNEVPKTPKEEYQKNKHRTFGKTNPQLSQKEFWYEMVRTGASAWHASDTYKDNNNNEPIWCYQRYGRTTTLLDDGRIIEIAGEHEDSYDPDFCIYNDVCLFSPSGDIQIYTYPREVFQPTDFHTATLIGDDIYIIGNLGYANDRTVGVTPVYKLSLATMRIESIETSGKAPGWIHDHKAKVKDNSIIITGGKVLNSTASFEDNEFQYEFCTVDKFWKS